MPRTAAGRSQPSANYSLLWDLKQVVGLLDLLDHVESETLRDLCSEQLYRFRARTGFMLGSLRSQVIYNDLNPSNVLVDSEDTGKLAGVIDFGDMVHSPLVVDVAVAAAYICCDAEDPLAGVVEFLSAYTGVVPLEDAEIAILFDLILMRHVMTVVIRHWRAARCPENRDYILRNEGKAKAMIERFTKLSANEVTERFRKASLSASASRR